jgi:hypothetical protein
MEITKVQLQEHGGYQVNDNMFVPDDMANRHRRKVQAWIDAGNTPTPYAEPVKTWLENRQENYPSIEELVVALYDTDDKAALEKRRSDVKAKYPKPE